jgi:hypothetical protein
LPRERRRAFAIARARSARAGALAAPIRKPKRCQSLCRSWSHAWFFSACGPKPAPKLEHPAIDAGMAQMGLPFG